MFILKIHLKNHKIYSTLDYRNQALYHSKDNPFVSTTQKHRNILLGSIYQSIIK